MLPVRREADRIGAATTYRAPVTSHGMSLLVDPHVLAAFSGQVQEASASVSKADAGRRASSAADGLPNSAAQWAARLVGAHIAEQAARIVTNLTEMGEAVHGAGNSYEVTDSELAGSFQEVFDRFEPP